MTDHCLSVTYYNKFHTCPCHGDIHTSQVTQKTYLAVVVGTHKRDDDDVAFLSLEAIDGIDGDESAEGFEVLALHKQAAQQLHLSTVR